MSAAGDNHFWNYHWCRTLTGNYLETWSNLGFHSGILMSPGVILHVQAIYQGKANFKSTIKAFPVVLLVVSTSPLPSYPDPDWGGRNSWSNMNLFNRLNKKTVILNLNKCYCNLFDRNKCTLPVASLQSKFLGSQFIVPRSNPSGWGLDPPLENNLACF